MTSGHTSPILWRVVGVCRPIVNTPKPAAPAPEEKKEEAKPAEAQAADAAGTDAPMDQTD